jgi:putative endonuclease
LQAQRANGGGEGNPGERGTTVNFARMSKDNYYYVYILANKRNGTLYVGETNNLFIRTSQHKLKTNKNSFAAKYNIHKLVYYEIYKYINDALAREKELKKWNREWKIKLIEKENPTWRDLYNDME